VVATEVGGTPALLGRGERGRLVPPGEPAALAQAVLETLTGSEAVRRRALAGREHVLSQHSSERLFRDMDGLYRELRSPKAA
jgi:glycosyltransferase involved in cell wall biosynthesis